LSSPFRLLIALITLAFFVPASPEIQLSVANTLSAAAIPLFEIPVRKES
jgi:hypothetical protein